MRATTSQKSHSFIYDFNTDGGVFGASIPMGTTLSPQGVIIYGYALILQNFTSLGAATFSVGFTGAGNEKYLIADALLPGLVQGATVSLTGAGIPGAALSPNMSELSVFIDVANLTGGKALFFLSVQEVPTIV